MTFSKEDLKKMINSPEYKKFKTDIQCFKCLSTEDICYCRTKTWKFTEILVRIYFSIFKGKK